MKPYYTDNYATIYHGDCREILPEMGDVDIVVTDPPYGIEFRSNYRKVMYEQIVGDGELPVDLVWLALSKATRAAYVFCRWDQLQQMPRPKSVIAWVKNNWSMGDLRHEHGRQWEACCFYPMVGHEFITRIPDVIHAKRTGNNLHPTEKPVDVIQAIIAANMGDTILDPFMGSGTTGVACVKTGRNFIGIEIDPTYYAIAEKRIAEAQLQTRLPLGGDHE